MISYRHADLIDKIKEPVEIRFEFGRQIAGTVFRGGSIENLEKDLNGNVLAMMKGMEDFIATLPGYVNKGHVSLIPWSPEIVVDACVKFAEKQKGYDSLTYDKNPATNDWNLLVMVRQ